MPAGVVVVSEASRQRLITSEAKEESQGSQANLEGSPCSSVTANPCTGSGKSVLFGSLSPLGKVELA